MDKERVRLDVNELSNLIFHELSTTQDPGDCNYQKFCREQLYVLANRITKIVFGAGDFSVGHFIMVLIHLNFLPSCFNGLLNAARFALSTSKLSSRDIKANHPNPKTISYLNSGSANGFKAKSSKARQLMESVQPHLVHGRGFAYCTDECLEQANCEAHRQKTVYDLHWAGQCSFGLPCAQPDSRRLLQLYPTYEEGSGFQVDVSEATNALSQMGFESTFFGSRARPISERKLYLGANSAKSSVASPPSYIQVRIPGDFIFAFSTLPGKIRSIMFGRHGSDWREFDHSNALRQLENLSILKAMAIFFSDQSKEGTATPADFRHLSPDDFIWTPTQVKYRTPDEIIQSPPVPPYRNYSAAGATYAGDQIQLDELEWNNYDADYIRQLNKLFKWKNSLELPASDTASTIDVVDRLNSSMSTPESSNNRQVTFSPLAPTVFGDIKQLGPNLSPTNISSLVVLDYPTIDHCKNILLKSMSSLQSITTKKKLQALTRMQLVFGSLHTEVMQAILPDQIVGPNCLVDGSIEILTKRSLLNGTISQDCLANSTMLRNHGKHQAYWKGVDGLNFFEVDRCILVDKIATALGGVNAVLTASAKPVWVFDSFRSAEKHFLLCLLLKAGSPNWFQKLGNRVCRLNRKQSLGEVTYPICCSVGLAGPSHAVPAVTLFHVVVDQKEEIETRTMSIGLLCEGTCPRSVHDSSCCLFFQAPSMDETILTAVSSPALERNRRRRKRKRENKRLAAAKPTAATVVEGTVSYGQTTNHVMPILSVSSGIRNNPVQKGQIQMETGFI